MEIIELKNIITKIKKSIDRLISRVEITEDRNTEFKDRVNSEYQNLLNQNIKLPYDPAISLLGIWTREMEIYGHTNTCK